MAEWHTVAPGIHQRRYDPFDISIVVVEGDDGLLSSTREPNRARASSCATTCASGSVAPFDGS